MPDPIHQAAAAAGIRTPTPSLQQDAPLFSLLPFIFWTCSFAAVLLLCYQLTPGPAASAAYRQLDTRPPEAALLQKLGNLAEFDQPLDLIWQSNLVNPFTMGCSPYGLQRKDYQVPPCPEDVYNARLLGATYHKFVVASYLYEPCIGEFLPACCVFVHQPFQAAYAQVGCCQPTMAGTFVGIALAVSGMLIQHAIWHSHAHLALHKPFGTPLYMSLLHAGGPCTKVTSYEHELWALNRVNRDSNFSKVDLPLMNQLFAVLLIPGVQFWNSMHEIDL